MRVQNKTLIAPKGERASLFFPWILLLFASVRGPSLPGPEPLRPVFAPSLPLDAGPRVLRPIPRCPAMTRTGALDLEVLPHDGHGDSYPCPTGHIS